jgi:putative transcriptional regulator
MRPALTVILLAIAIFPSAYAQEAARKEAVLLVAHPAMTDLRFAETVVLVMFPPDAGPEGVVLNKPSLVELKSVWPDRPDRQGRTDIVHYGGPVEPDGLLFVFRMTPTPQRALWVTEDVYFSGDGDLLNKLLEEKGPVAHQRFFAGYAGWAPGQLEDEIKRNGWLTVGADLDVIFQVPPEGRYDAALRALGVTTANLSDVAGHA